MRKLGSLCVTSPVLRAPELDGNRPVGIHRKIAARDVGKRVRGA